MRLATALAVSLAVVGCARAGSSVTTISQVTPKSTAGIQVSAPTFTGGVVDQRHTSNGAGLSPPLSWTPVAGAKSYAVIVEDPDAPMGRPFVHWLIWNLPATATSLPEGVPAGAQAERPVGAAQGQNDADVVGYWGPKPPSGTHHYHFEVFALDGPLSAPAGSDIGAVQRALPGHVLADGELVATYTAR